MFSLQITHTTPHMIHTSNFSGIPLCSRGHHCERFDTDLVEQIIEVEIDARVRRLRDERGCTVDGVTQHRWKEELREVLVHTALEEEAHHGLLPAEFCGCLQRTLDDVIEVECPVTEKSVSRSTVVDAPSSILLRFLMFCNRFARKIAHP